MRRFLESAPERFSTAFDKLVGHEEADFVLVHQMLVNREGTLTSYQAAKLYSEYKQCRELSVRRMFAREDSSNVVLGTVTAYRKVGKHKDCCIHAFSLKNYKKVVCLLIEKDVDKCQREVSLIKQSRTFETPIYVVEYPDAHATGFSMVDAVRAKKGSLKGVLDLSHHLNNSGKETFLVEM